MKACSASTTCRLWYQTFSILFIVLFICISMTIGCSKSEDLKTQEIHKQPSSNESQQISQLIERLLYSNENTKIEARKYLSSLDDTSKSKLVPELVNVLKHYPYVRFKQASGPNEVIARYRAAETLGILGPIAKDSAPALIEAMNNDDSDLVRNRATAALTKIGLDTDKLVPVLIDTLNHSYEATNAIAELGPKAVPALIIALQDSSVQSGAAIALGKMGRSAKDVSPALLEAMKTAKNDRLKRVFSEALDKIGPADATDMTALVQDLQNVDIEIRYKAIDALAVKGKQVAPTVVKLIDNSSPETRFWVAYILGRNKADTKEALTALTGLLKDENNFVRGNAIWALREINPRDFQSKDIQDDELTAIDHILIMKPKDDDILIQTIYRLGELLKTYPQSPKLDQVYFKSGLAKIAIGSLIGDTRDHSLLVQDYLKQHKDDYFSFLGIMYTGGDLKTLVDNYPNSPLAPQAMLLIADEKSKVGECETDIDCYIDSAIRINLPFLQRYPNHPEVKRILKEINSEMTRLDRGEDLFNIDETSTILKEYYAAIPAIENKDIRGEALYPLARAFISVGQYNLAESIYKDLENNYPKYRNAKSKAAYQIFDDSEQVPRNYHFDSQSFSQLASGLANKSDEVRLATLDKIGQSKINDSPLLFSLLLLIGNMSEKDELSTVRKRCIEVIGSYTASTLTFYSSAVGNCLLFDPDKQNQDYCAELGVNHPTLKSTNLYVFNRDRINSIISEKSGKPYPSREMIEEAQAKAIQRDREAALEIVNRAKKQGINIYDSETSFTTGGYSFQIDIFGSRYVVTNKFRPEVVIPLWIVMMLLCGTYCFRIARQRNANAKLWACIGAMTAPLSILFVVIIPRKNML